MIINKGGNTAISSFDLVVFSFLGDNMIKREKNKYIIYNDKNEVITVLNKHPNKMIVCYNIPSIVILGNDINNINVYNEALINSLNIDNEKRLMTTKDIYDVREEDERKVRIDRLLNIRNFIVCKCDFDESIKEMSFRCKNINYNVEKMYIGKLIYILGKKYTYSDSNLKPALEMFQKVYVKGR